MDLRSLERKTTQYNGMGSANRFFICDETHLKHCMQKYSLKININIRWYYGTLFGMAF